MSYTITVNIEDNGIPNINWELIEDLDGTEYQSLEVAQIAYDDLTEEFFIENGFIGPQNITIRIVNWELIEDLDGDDGVPNISDDEVIQEKVLYIE